MYQLLSAATEDKQLWLSSLIPECFTLPPTCLFQKDEQHADSDPWHFLFASNMCNVSQSVNFSASFIVLLYS
jgi:hypothetical protein